MTAIKTLLKPAILGFGILGLAACQHTDVGAPSLTETVARNSVQMVRLPLEIQSESDGTHTLSHVTETALDNFFTSIEAGYGDVIMLDGPDVSAERIKAVEAYVRKRGLAYAGTSALGAKPAPGSVVLYVERYLVTTPNCNYWPEVTSTQEKNNDSSFHGCSSTINLGLMIADPRDLVTGKNSGNSTAAAVRAIFAPARQTGGEGGTPSSAPDTSGLEGAVQNMPGADAGSGN